MAKLATQVADGQQAVADHYNNMLNDLLQEHAHSGPGDGGTVNHGDMLDGIIANTYHDHSNMRTHLMGAGTEFVDTPGGGSGVHGLPDWADVMGSQGEQLFVQRGISVTNDSETVGDYEVQIRTTDIVFPAAYENVANNPAVFIVVLDTHPAAVAIDEANYDNTKFRPLIWMSMPTSKSEEQYAVDFLWIAVGTMA